MSSEARATSRCVPARRAGRGAGLAALVAAVLALAAPRPGADDTSPFRPPAVPHVSSLQNIALGDLDGDGDPELAATGLDGGLGGVRVFENIGGACFGPPVFYLGGDNEVLFADVNADGRLDLLQGDRGLDALNVRLGNGQGAFGPFTTYPLLGNPVEPVVVDVSGDGIVDLVVPIEGNANTVSVLLGLGGGAFGPRVDHPSGGSGAVGCAVADMDGDRVLDILLVNETTDDVTILPGAGDGTFGPAGAPIDVDDAPQSGAVGDLDGDGDLDVVTSHDSPVSTGLTVLLGDGAGGFAAPVLVPVSSAVRELALADLDEDGALDVACASRSFSFLAVLYGRGDGTFEPFARHAAGYLPIALEVADLNGDGDLDLVSGGVEEIVIQLGLGERAFDSYLALADQPRDAVPGDLDGDGDLDLAVASSSVTSFALRVYRNDGGGRFTPTHVHATDELPSVLVTADFTEDGLDDVFVGLRSAALAYGGQLFTGTASGPLAGPTSLSVPPRTRWAGSGDFDGDDHLDLVTVHDDTGIWLSYGHGDGSFDAAVAVNESDFFEGFDLGDVDGDGRDDLVLVVQDSIPFGPAFNQIAVFRGRPDGTFDFPVFNALEAAAGAVALGDLDGDGTLDVVYGSGGVCVRLGQGDGTLGPEQACHPATAFVRHLATGDFDDDGLLDVAATSGVSSHLEPGFVDVFLGAGDGTLQPIVTLTLGPNAARLHAGDVDGDGVDDVVAVAENGGHVLVALSRAGPWRALGKGLAGTTGIPRLLGEGTLMADDPYRITLRDALPNGSTAIFVGLSELCAPFKGGLLVPFPDIVLAGLPTDGDGQLVLAGAWPVVPPGIAVFLQYVDADPAAPQGFSLSNGLRMLTQ